MKQDEATWAEFVAFYAMRRKQVAIALEKLGVQTPALPVRAKLEAEGFAIIPALLDMATCEHLAGLIMDAAHREGDGAAADGHLERGAIRVGGVLGRGDPFDRLVFDPVMLSVVSFILSGDLHLSTVTARAPELGGGGQRFHSDWHVPAPNGKWQAVNVIWALDDFTEENGATELMPRTHLVSETPGAMPDKIVISAEMARGSALIYNAHLWHRGTRNASGRRRIGVHVFFTRTCYPQRANLRETLSAEMRERFTAEERALLNL
jgi:Phytanoyl-CoA dioxygenase (PhyH)